MNRKTVKNKMHHKAHEESRNIFDLFSVVSVPSVAKQREQHGLKPILHDATTVKTKPNRLRLRAACQGVIL